MTQPLPLLPLRDCSLLPGTTRVLKVGRPGSLAALARVQPGGLLIFARQRMASMRSPRELRQLFQVACTGRVVRRWTTEAGQERVEVEGVERVYLGKLFPQMVMLSAQVIPQPADLDADTADAADAVYDMQAEQLGLEPACGSSREHVYRLASALVDRVSEQAVLEAADLGELLVELLEQLDGRLGLNWVH